MKELMRSVAGVSLRRMVYPTFSMLSISMAADLLQLLPPPLIASALFCLALQARRDGRDTA